MRVRFAQTAPLALLCMLAVQAQLTTTTNWDGETVIIGPTTDKWGDSWTGVITTLTGPVAPLTPAAQSSNSGTTSRTASGSSASPTTSPSSSSSATSRQTPSPSTPVPSLVPDASNGIADGVKTGTIVDFTSYMASLSPSASANPAALHVSGAAAFMRPNFALLAGVPLLLAAVTGL